MAAGDPEMAEFAREEIASLSQQIERETQLLKVLLLPKDPLDEKNIMLEARTTVPHQHENVSHFECTRVTLCS